MINQDIFNKSGLMRMNIARDFYLMNPGERIPTILEYTERSVILLPQKCALHPPLFNRDTALLL